MRSIFLAGIALAALTSPAVAQQIGGQLCVGSSVPPPTGAIVDNGTWAMPGVCAAVSPPPPPPVSPPPPPPVSPPPPPPPVSPPPPPPPPTAAIIPQPSPLPVGTYTLNGTLVPASPTTHVAVNWYTASGTVAPLPVSSWLQCTTSADGVSFSCPGVIIDHAGVQSYLWADIIGSAPYVAWSATPTAAVSPPPPPPVSPPPPPPVSPPPPPPTASGITHFISASGNNANDGLTTVTPWLDEANISTTVFPAGSVIAFHGSDSFAGCPTITGGGNVTSTRSNKIWITSYGGGRATLKPTCTAPAAKVGVLNLDKTDGLVVDNLHIACDMAGQAGRGISVTNSDGSNDHGTLYIQRSVIEDCHDGVDADMGAAIMFDQSKNNGAGMIDHVNILANIFRGTQGPTSLAENGVESYGYNTPPGSLQYDAVAGNLAYNLGGKPSTTGGNAYTGNGALISGTGTRGRYAFGARVYGNLEHNSGANLNNCGSRYAWWSYNTDSVLFRMNGAANDSQKGGCDGGGFDADIGSTNVTIDRNHCEHEWGPCAILYDGGSMKWGPNAVTNNWSHDSAYFNQSSFSWNNPSAKGVGVFSHNWAQQLTGGSVFSIQGGGGACGAPGSSVDHNYFGSGPGANGVTWEAYIQLGWNNVACTGTPNFSLNTWWTQAGDPNRLLFRNGPQFASTTLAAWQTIAPGGDAGSVFASVPSGAIIPPLGLTLSATDKAAIANAVTLVAADPYIQQDPYIATRLPQATAVANGTAISGPEVEDILAFVLVWSSQDPNACALLRRLTMLPDASCLLTQGISLEAPPTMADRWRPIPEMALPPRRQPPKKRWTPAHK